MGGARHPGGDGSHDLQAVLEVGHWVSGFRRWLDRENETRPLGECGMEHGRILHHRKRVPLEVIYLPASRLDPAFPADLDLGVFWTPDGSKAPCHGFRTTTLGQHPRHLCLVAVRSDPRPELDVAWSMDWDVLTHEVTHYRDFGRGYGPAQQRAQAWAESRGKPFLPRSSTQRGLEAHFNSPVEYNAYCQAALTRMVHAMAYAVAKGKAGEYANKHLGTFEGFFAEFKGGLSYEFARHANPDTMQRLARRTYRVWDVVASQWPDIPQVQALAAQYQKGWQALEAADLEQARCPTPA